MMKHNNPTILVVDDEPRVLELIQHILEREDFNVFTASSAKEALNILDVASPDLVLVDVVMPSIDGYTLCRQLHERTSAPVVLMSGTNEENGFACLLDSGAEGFICKPFSMESLTMAVAANLGEIRQSMRETNDRFFRDEQVTVWPLVNYSPNVSKEVLQLCVYDCSPEALLYRASCGDVLHRQEITPEFIIRGTNLYTVPCIVGCHN